MPKIVDHEAYRQELALRAATLFSKHGYSGLGMRKISQELGISKSALYHYFPTKMALFTACTDAVTQLELPEGLGDCHAESAVEQRVAALVGFARELEQQFADEMRLLFDYLREKSTEEIAADETLRLAVSRHRALVASLVPQDCVQQVLSTIMGFLLMRYFDGGNTSFEALEDWLSQLLLNASGDPESD